MPFNLPGAPVTVASNVILVNPAVVAPSVASNGQALGGTVTASVMARTGKVGSQGQVVGNANSIPTVVFSNPA